MATSKTFEIYKNFRYLAQARKVGYYDAVELFQGTEQETSINLPALTPYDGLSMVQESNDFGSADTVDFSKTILPWKWDYYNTLLTSKYCLMPYGETYKVVDVYDTYNFTVFGSPTVDFETLTVGNFSTSNYLKIKGTRKYTADQLKSFEVVYDVTTGSSIAESGRLLQEDIRADSTIAPTILEQTIDFAMYWYDGSTYNGVAAVEYPQVNTHYLLKWTYDGTTVRGYNSTDGGQTWSEGGSMNFKPYWNLQDFKIGVRDNNSVTISNCKVHLENTYIKINDEMWWTPKIAKPKKEPSITVTSASKIDGTVVYAPFSLGAASRDITFYKDKSFEIIAKIITPNTDNACQQFITLSDPNNQFNADSGVIFFRKNPNNKFEAGLYTRANSYWNIGRGGSYIANKEQYLRIYYDPSTQSLYFYVSDNGSSWNQVYAVSMIMNFLGYGAEVSEVTPVIYFGSWGDGTAEAMQTGAIDFSGCFVYVDGVEVWNGAKNTLTTIEGCTYNYTDNGQATTLNCYTINGNERVVLTPDSTYDGRYLGTVDIAEHTAYDYIDGEWIKK